MFIHLRWWWFKIWNPTKAKRIEMEVLKEITNEDSHRICEQ